MNKQNITLVCLHHAGGSGLSFSPWKNIGKLNGINVVAPSLPGRAELYKETVIKSPEQAIQWILDEVWGRMSGAFHIFGHSLGGQLAFHSVSVAAELGLPLPLSVHISAARPATKKASQVIKAQAITDKEALYLLKSLGGATEKQLANPIWLQKSLPLLRDDLILSQQLTMREGTKLPGQLNLYGSFEDAFTPVESLQGWEEMAESSHLKVYNGGHFYLHKNPKVFEDIMQSITCIESKF